MPPNRQRQTPEREIETEDIPRSFDSRALSGFCRVSGVGKGMQVANLEASGRRDLVARESRETQDFHAPSRSRFPHGPKASPARFAPVWVGYCIGALWMHTSGRALEAPESGSIDCYRTYMNLSIVCTMDDVAPRTHVSVSGESPRRGPSTLRLHLGSAPRTCRE